MIYLVPTVVFTVLLFIIFREFSKRNIDTLQAITFNYLCAGILALLFTDFKISDVNFAFNSKWILYAIILGIYFIVMFNVMAKTTQKLGVTISSLSSKMSLVIPVLAGVLFQNEQISSLKIAAIFIALLSIYLTITKNENKRGPLYLAIILFFGTGILDTSLSLIQYNFISNDKEANLFTSTIFLIAFVCGSIYLIFKRNKLKLKNILAGIVLGIPNFFSIYFLLKTLEFNHSSLVFPIINIGVVALSTLIGWKFYSEQLSLKNVFGLFLAGISMIILIYS
jgi:drug/metabolite transporter (DMT)-like permease